MVVGVGFEPTNIINERIYRAFFYSMSGFKTALKKEAAFRQDCMLIAAIFISTVFFKISYIEVIILIISSAILLITELLNSAVEWNVDLATKEIHPLAKGAKDMGSAAVFVALANLIVVYCAILFASFF